MLRLENEEMDVTGFLFHIMFKGYQPVPTSKNPEEARRAKRK